MGTINKIIIYNMKYHHFILLGLTILITSCNNSKNDYSVNCDLKELVDVGYSIKELSMRTDYSEHELIEAYQKNEDILTDSIKNDKLHFLSELNREEKVIPVNKTNISAYDAIWQVYTNAQNLPRVSLYTGIGVTKVANALMKRKTLNEDDSIKALIGYVNMKYGLEDMPPSIDKYFTKTSIIKDIVVPQSFTPNYSDDVKLKIEYYIWQNEQFELKANENLRKSIENRIDSHIEKSIDDFIVDDLNSLINTSLNLFKDSLETDKFYREKLNKRLSFDSLDKSIQDEIITYCISVNCSRAMLIGEILNYQDFSKRLSANNKKIMSDYVSNLEGLTMIMQKKKENLGIDAAIFAVTIPITIFTAGAINPSNTFMSIQALKIFILEMFEYEGIDRTFKTLFNYNSSESEIERTTQEMKEYLKDELNGHISKSLNSKNNCFDALNQNTTEYYNDVRTFFNIKK